MNLIAKSWYGHMRSCMCKNNTIRLPQGFNKIWSGERCTTNFTIVIHRREFFCQNKGLLNKSFDNALKCNDARIGPYNVHTNSSKYLASCLNCYCTSTKKDEEKPLSLFQKFKALYRSYWYVLVPVHMATSAVWFGGFYYMAKTGVDIIPILEFLRVSDSIIDKFRSEHFEKAGYFALAFAFYKLATPLRYASTLGGTTLAINYLKKLGFIKPIPSNQKLKEMCMEQKQALIDRKNQIKDNVIKNKLSLIQKKNRWNNRVHKAFKNVGVPEADSPKRTTKRNVSRTKKDSNGQEGSNQK